MGKVRRLGANLRILLRAPVEPISSPLALFVSLFFLSSGTVKRAWPILVFVGLDLSDAYERILQPLLPSNFPDRLDMPEWLLPWVVWGVLATFNDIRRGTSRERNEISQAISQLQSYTIASSDVTAYSAFLAVSNELALGAKFYMIPNRLQDRLGNICNWDSELGRIMACMVLAGVVDSQRVQELHFGQPRSVEFFRMKELGRHVINKSANDVFKR